MKLVQLALVASMAASLGGCMYASTPDPILSQRDAEFMALIPNGDTDKMFARYMVDNPTGEVLPGAYVVVRLRVGREARGLTIPANTLLFRSEGLRVAVVRNGRAELVPVTIGRDYGLDASGGLFAGREIFPRAGH